MKKILSISLFISLVICAIAQEDMAEKAFVERTESGEIVHRIVDEMPRFPGCEDSGKAKALRNACAKDKLVSFISNELKYPKMAADSGTEGMVLVSFIVAENGDIQEAEVKRNIGDGCGEEALRVVSVMPRWIPGRQAGEAVKVRFNLPIMFKLNDVAAPVSVNEIDQYKLVWSGTRAAEGIAKSDLERLSETKVYIRDLYGKNIPITELIVEYERGLKYKKATGAAQINEAMSKVIRKASKRGRITLTVVIQGKEDFLTMRREYVVH